MFHKPLPPGLADASFLHFERDGTARAIPRARGPTAVRALTLLVSAAADLNIGDEMKPFVRKLIDGEHASRGT